MTREYIVFSLLEQRWEKEVRKNWDLTKKQTMTGPVEVSLHIM
jgi:hypothetical protein